MKRILFLFLCGIFITTASAQEIRYDTIITIRVLDRLVYDTTIIARTFPEQISDSPIEEEISMPVEPEVPVVIEPEKIEEPEQPEIPIEEEISMPVEPEVPVVVEPEIPIEEEISMPVEPEVPVVVEPEIPIEEEISMPVEPEVPVVVEPEIPIEEEISMPVEPEVPVVVEPEIPIEEEISMPVEPEVPVVVEPEIPIEEEISMPVEPEVPVVIEPEIIEEPEEPEIAIEEEISLPAEPELPELVPVVDDASIMSMNIDVKDLSDYVSFLAADDMEGRATGQPGQKKAAEFIARKFKEFGIPPIGPGDNYFQEVPFVREQWDNIGITANGLDFAFLKDFYSFSKSNRSRDSIVVDEVIFLGYGIDDEIYSDYDGVDVQDKVILIYQGEPMNQDSVSYITGTREFSDWALNWRKKLRIARNKGVKAVLFIERNIPFYVSRYTHFLVEPHVRLAEKDEAAEFANSCYISTELAREIIGKKFEKVVKARDKTRDTGKPQDVKLNCNLIIRQGEKKEEFTGENVLGYIEGLDPNLRSQHIVITAHYDHLGMRGADVYNGADDNASGTSAVLELAQAFAKAKEEGLAPRRSILLMAVSGEEIGLLGSEYYTDHPFLPLNYAVANLNMDMIGRSDKNHEGNSNYIYVIGSDRLSTELHEINEAVNRKYLQVQLDYTYNAFNDPNRYYYRSDHYNFAEKGVPAIFFFSGAHQDYHRISDTVDKLNIPKMERIARLVFHTAWELANRDKRIKVNAPVEKASQEKK